MGTGDYGCDRSQAKPSSTETEGMKERRAGPQIQVMQTIILIREWAMKGEGRDKNDFKNWTIVVK